MPFKADVMITAPDEPAVAVASPFVVEEKLNIAGLDDIHVAD